MDWSSAAKFGLVNVWKLDQESIPVVISDANVQLHSNVDGVFVRQG
jgi:hypothetical protein